MSEGPEVRIVADKISKSLIGRIIMDITISNLDDKLKSRVIGSTVDYIKTYGKNIVIKFSSGVYLRNHMMMWGKWRIYDREKYDKGLAIPPPRRAPPINKKSTDSKTVKDVRNDSRVRLTIITSDQVLIEFNGPILQFSLDDPAKRDPIISLGPDALTEQFDINEVKKRMRNKNKLLLSESLLDQNIVCGIGNKYKSEILFITKIWPFKKIDKLTINEENIILKEISKSLLYGYINNGRTRPLLENEKKNWDTKHWVFRRTGHPCWICNTKIISEKKLTKRSTFWCPKCQFYNNT